MAADHAHFHALSDPARRRVLEELVRGGAPTAEIARRCGLPRTNVEHHLAVLARAGLARRRRGHAAADPEGLAVLRRYFDLALSAASVASLRD